jgi:5-methylcytosine-specific restriction endonuclease McrA
MTEKVLLGKDLKGRDVELDLQEEKSEDEEDYGEQASDKICFFCGENNGIVLVRHHIIPKSLKSIDPTNYGISVILCRNCHQKLHYLLTPLTRYLTVYLTGKDPWAPGRQEKPDYSKLLAETAERLGLKKLMESGWGVE